MELPPHGGKQRWTQGQRDMYLRLFGEEINGAFFVFIMWFNDAIRLIKRMFFNVYTFIYTFPLSQRETQWSNTNISLLSPTRSAAGLFIAL